MSRSFSADFTRGPVLSQLVRFSLPLFLSNLLQILYNMADMVIVGQVMGPVGLSAVSVGGDVSAYLTLLAMGFSNAGQVIIAQYMGAGKRAEVGRFIGTMFLFLWSVALVLSGLCLYFCRDLLNIMNTPPESFSEALAYSSVCISGTVFITGYNTVSAVLRGIGDSRHPFVFISIAAVLNVLLDLLFVMGLRMGAGGAALATVMAQGVSFLLCSVFMIRNRHRLGFEICARDFLRPDRAMMGRLLRLGLPMSVKSGAVHFSKLFVNSWINSYGVSVSAFAGIANKISSISNLFSNALNTAGSSMVGQNIGAGRHERVPAILMACAGFSAVIAAVMSSALVLWPGEVFSLFTRDADVAAIGLSYVPVGVLVFFGAASRAPSNALVNGSGNYKVNFATALLDGLILRITLGLFFGLTLDMKHVGFWLGDALAGFTPMVIAAVFYLSGSWKKSIVG